MRMQCDQVKNSITEKFQPFVVLLFYAHFMSIGLVGQSAVKEREIAKGIVQPLL